jgi:hypothetical protein
LAGAFFAGAFLAGAFLAGAFFFSVMEVTVFLLFSLAECKIVWVEIAHRNWDQRCPDRV